MFDMSVKSVPGCFVLIVPRMIGLPVALTPGFGPQDEDPPLLELLAAAVELLAAAEDVPLELLLLLLLLPHPASATSESAANSTRPYRMRGTR